MDETKPNQTPNQTQPPTPGIWIEGAKALAAFQEQHTAIAKSGEVKFSKAQYSYADLSDVLQAVQPAATHGLSHSGQPRVLGTQGMVWREYLHHSSGEQIWAEYYIPLPQSPFFSGDDHKQIGGGITYARKYCIQSLFGLYGDNSIDPDAIQGSPKNPPTSAAAPVAAPEQQQQSVVVTPNDGQTPITGEQKAAALKICKENPEVKAAFMKQYNPNVTTGMTAKMLKLKEHHDFITTCAEAPF